VIGVTVLVGKIIAAHDLGRAAHQQGSDDRMTVRVVLAHDLCKRALEEIADRYALANVQVAERVYVHTLRIPQVLPRAFGELLPRLCFDQGGEFFRCATPVQHRGRTGR